MTPTKLHIPKSSMKDYETPPATFEELDKRFGPFDLDAACLPDQLTAMTILSRGGHICVPMQTTRPNWPEDVLLRIHTDGLTTLEPAHSVWLNPPFDALAEWLEVVTLKVESGQWRQVTVLMPARTDTKYWQEYVFKEARRLYVWTLDAHPTLHTVVNLKGRLTFVGADAPFTQPCIAAVFGYDVEDKKLEQ